MTICKEELFRDSYDLRRRYGEFYDLLYCLLQKKSDSCEKYPNEFLLPQDIMMSDSGISISELQKNLSDYGYDYSIEEINLIMYDLIAKQQRVIRKDYWGKEPIYEFIDRYYWASRLQRNFHSFKDDEVGKSKRFAFISDTHIGLDGVYNPVLINNFYDYIIGKGATRCFHLGDLFEGINNVSIDEKEKFFLKQIELFLKDYPKPDSREIITYFTGGNHDESIGLFMGGCPLKDIDLKRDDNGYSNSTIEYIKEDYNALRYITAMNPSVVNIPQSKFGIDGWSTEANGRRIHFNHRLFLSCMQMNCRINNVDGIQDKMLFMDHRYDMLISGHLHKGLIYSIKDKLTQKDKLYLGIPSTSSINLNGVVGYFAYLDEDGKEMEISILGSDSNGNIREIDKINWNFDGKNKQYCKQF